VVAPRSRQLATDLLRAEAESSGTPCPAQACRGTLERLYGVLSPLIGAAGFETVLARAVVRSSVRYPSVARLLIPRTGIPSVEAVADALADTDGADAAVTLVDEMITFLGRLIGCDLTLRALLDEWPDVVTGYDAATPSHTSNPDQES
jgi:hypothetical protein